MRSQSPFETSLWLRLIVFLAVVVIPFDAVASIPALGELGYELSFPFFALGILLALVVCLANGSNRLTSSLALRVGAGILAVIFLSWLVNSIAIDSALVRERSGINKFATSLLVVLYGIALAWLAEQMDEEHVATLLTRAIVWSAAIVTAYGFFELIGRSGPLSPVFSAVDGLIHTRQNDIINAWNGSINYKLLYQWDPRLRSVSFEPPAFGNFCGLAWPWVWFAAVTAPPARKLRAWAVLIGLTLIIAFGGTRTGMLILGIDVTALILLRWLYAPRVPTGDAGAVFRLALPAIAILTLLAAAAYVGSDPETLVGRVAAGDSVSNISRLGFQIAALQMFFAHPVFGVGLGQFAFHAAEFLPDWAYRSPEVAPMLYYPTGPWPAVYSLYGRLAAELGLVGLLGWVSLWLVLAWRLVGIARNRASRALGYGIEYPLVLTTFGILASGIASDTFRTPMFWIALGCSCGLIRSARAAATGETVSEELSPAPVLSRSL